MRIKIQPFSSMLRWCCVLFSVFVLSCSSETKTEEICSKVCNAGYVLNDDCKCVKGPCEIVCDAGFVLDSDNCKCEKEPCEKVCDAGFVLNANSCECEEKVEGVFPVSDANNTQGWVLNEELTDEFEADVLDEDKWLVQGRGGVYRSNFKGRLPWQYSTGNFRLEDGMLKLVTKHEPDFAWIGVAEEDKDKYKYTTAGINTKKSFKNGYMEIKCKLPVAKTVHAFWTTGDGVLSELDVFEGIGKGDRQQLMWSTVHDWSIPNPNKVWTVTNTLPFSMSDGFHVYGAEWENDWVKIYADGVLVKTATRDWVEANGIDSKKWPMTGPQRVWIDSEIFPWWGEPEIADLPAEFHVEYMRVWQKE
ncbi:glycoside hydrolase family 16 protein [Wenyingzhuangia sp. IMCC45574]